MYNYTPIGIYAAKALADEEREEREERLNKIIRIPYKLMAETDTKPGLGLDGKIAEDLKDVSYLKEIKDSQKEYWEKHKNIFSKKDNELFEMMKTLFFYTSRFNLNDIGHDMCEKFYKGTKGNYSDKRLSRNVFGSNEFKEYHKKILDSIRTVIYRDGKTLPLNNPFKKIKSKNDLLLWIKTYPQKYNATPFVALSIYICFQITR